LSVKFPIFDWQIFLAAARTDVLFRLHTEANDQDIEAFAMMVFDKLGTFVDGVVSASGIQEEIISKPLLVEFFQLKKYMLTRTKSGSDSGSRPLKGSSRLDAVTNTKSGSKIFDL
jgi:hypothetical protein